MLPAMGLLGRIVDRIVRTKAEHRGARFESQGKLEEAYEAYLAVGQLVDAARVMLARAQAEPDPSKRIALLNLAASRAPATSAPAREARHRAVLLRLDLVRASKTTALTSELLDLARELEALDLLREAGEAYGLAGDTENQTRILVACGAIDDLEDALESERRDRSEKREREVTWREIKDLDSIGKRIDCLRRCETWLTESPRDETVAAFARTVRERLVQHGSIPLELEGQRVELVVDHPLTIGRAEASVVLPSPALSRQHLSVRRVGAEAIVEDLGSRNGTWLAGARVDAALPVGQGIELKLGGQVPCKLQPWPGGGVKISLPGRVIVAPLGPLRIANFEITPGREGNIQLVAHGAAPILNGLTADATVDLSYGDEICQRRGGPVLIRVVGS